MNTSIERVTTEEAINRGYLEDRIVYLKPIPRKGKMIKDPGHSGYFMYDGAYEDYCLAKNRSGELINIFNSDEEREFFEKTLDLKLSTFSKANEKFWNNFRVKFIKSADSMKRGQKFDLSVPIENLKYRVLKSNSDRIIDDWEKRFDRPSYRFCLVDADYETTASNLKFDMMQKAFTKYGELKTSPKRMKEFLSIFLSTYDRGKTIPETMDQKFLERELTKIIEEKQAKFVELAEDPNYDIKVFIYKGLASGAIEKIGVNKYLIVGESVNHEYTSLVNYLKNAKKTTDDVYFKIQNQIDIAKL